jgi:hypothetical protein
MTTISEVTQKRNYLEEFNCVVALYSVLKANSTSLRVKQAVYRQDEVAAEPLDFIIDVEIKVKRTIGQMFYDMFLRAVFNENLEILSEELRTELGRTFFGYGLGLDGAYAKLYYKTKNDQVRSYMREQQNGIFGINDATDYD